VYNITNVKIIFWIQFKKVDTIIFSEISLNAQMIHETISSSNGFFWCSVTVKAWILSAIYCIQPFHYSRKTKGYRTKANLRGSFLLQRILQSHFSHVILKGVHIFPSHHVTHAKLQIHFRLSSEFLAFTIFDWSPKSGCLTGCLFKEQGQFQVDWNCYFFIASVLLLNHSSICLHTSNGCQSKNKGFRV